MNGCGSGIKNQILKMKKIFNIYIVFTLVYVGVAIALFYAGSSGYSVCFSLEGVFVAFPLLVLAGLILLITLIVQRLRKEMESALFRKYALLLLLSIAAPFIFLVILLSQLSC
ncbi:MAG: hypothetical protein JWP12_1723 [Bacteroidetes bacterium]|nr:hypothetical protein [Bacteroidota bacterium]